jgi:hypothetical protein
VPLETAAAIAKELAKDASHPDHFIDAAPLKAAVEATGQALLDAGAFPLHKDNAGAISACRCLLAFAALLKRGWLSTSEHESSSSSFAARLQDEIIVPGLRELPACVARKWTTAIQQSHSFKRRLALAWLPAVSDSCRRPPPAVGATLVPADDQSQAADPAPEFDAAEVWLAARRKAAQLALELVSPVAAGASSEPTQVTPEEALEPAWAALPTLLGVPDDARGNSRAACRAAADAMSGDDADLVWCVWRLWHAEIPAGCSDATRAAAASLLHRPSLLAALASVLGHSESVAIEWLLGDETTFLELLLDIARWTRQQPEHHNGTDAPGRRERQWLGRLCERLRTARSFPYDTAPLVRMLTGIGAT